MLIYKQAFAGIPAYPVNAGKTHTSVIGVCVKRKLRRRGQLRDETCMMLAETPTEDYNIEE